ASALRLKVSSKGKGRFSERVSLLLKLRLRRVALMPREASCTVALVFVMVIFWMEAAMSLLSPSGVPVGLGGVDAPSSPPSTGPDCQLLMPWALTIQLMWRPSA